MTDPWADVREEEGCTCQGCGQSYKVDFLLADNLWQTISDGKNLLCGKCIVDALEHMGFGGYWVFDVTDADALLAVVRVAKRNVTHHAELELEDAIAALPEHLKGNDNDRSKR
jgi:hypothetical protein